MTAAGPIPKNKPVPMEPPKAISCICRLDNPLFNSFFVLSDFKFFKINSLQLVI